MSKISSLLKAISEERENLKRKRTELDQLVSQYYHIIELVDLPAHKSSQLQKKFKQVLKERREVKHELAKLNNINFVSSERLDTALEKADRNLTKFNTQAKKAYEELLGGI